MISQGEHLMMISQGEHFIYLILKAQLLSLTQRKLQACVSNINLDIFFSFHFKKGERDRGRERDGQKDYKKEGVGQTESIEQ